MPYNTSGKKIGAYGPNMVDPKYIPRNSIRERNVKRTGRMEYPAEHGGKKSHNPY